MILKNMPLMGKMLLGFALILALLCGVAYVGYSGLASVARRVDSANAAHRLVRGMLTARDHVREFMISGAQEDADAVSRTLDDVRTSIEQLTAKVADDHAAALLDQVSGKADDFVETFTTYVALHGERTTTMTTMDEQADEVLTQLARIRRAQDDQLQAQRRQTRLSRNQTLRHVADANRIIHWVADARAQEKAFLLNLKKTTTDTADIVAAVEERTQRIIALADEMTTQFTAAENHMQAAAIATEARAYQAAFSTYVAEHQAELEAETLMENAALGLEEEARAILEEQQDLLRAATGTGPAEKAARADILSRIEAATQIIVSILEARKEEKDFRFTGDGRAREQIDDYMAAILDIITASLSDIDDGFQAAILTDAVTTYQAAFSQYADALHQQREAEDRMIASAQRLEEEARAIRQTQEQALVALLNDSDRFLSEALAGVETANHLTRQFLEIRQYEKSGILFGDPVKLEAAHVGIDEMLSAADDFRATLRDDDNLAALDQVIAAVRAYHDLFTTYFDLMEQQDTADTAMERAAIAAQTASDAVNAAQMERMAAQIHQVDLMTVGGTALALIFGIAIALAITRGITRPLSMIVETADAIADGNFEKEITIYQEDEIGRLANAFRNMNSRIKDVQEETRRLSLAVQEGRLRARGQSEAFAGGWRELIDGMNSIIEAFVAPLSITARYLERMAEGDLPEQLSQRQHGDFEAIQRHVNQLIGNIGAVLAEARTLVQAVEDGDLARRGDAAAYSGDWQALVQGMNNILDAFTRPLFTASATLSRIARGELPREVAADAGRGDFSRITDSVTALIGSIHEITQLSEAIAAGDLTVAIRERSSGDALMQALNRMAQRLHAIVAGVQEVADNVSAGAADVSQRTAQLSEGASKQAAAAQEVAASMEQMTANIRQNSNNALNTERIAVKSAEAAHESAHAVTETIEAITDIIKKIGIIEEIARQTHMLSLNATIEAATAREYGKGFGVVASEVRTLAERSQSAAVEINQLAATTIAAAERAGDMLADLVPDIQQTSMLVQEIAAASQEQKTGANQVNRAIQQLDSVTQQNAASAEEIAATSEALSAHATQLRETVAVFTIDTTRPFGGPAMRSDDFRDAHRPAAVAAPTPAAPQTTERLPDDAEEQSSEMSDGTA